MAGFKVDIWKRRQKEAQLREKYGEHAEIMIRSLKMPTDKKKKVEHSFPHLLNKVYVVEQLDLPKFDDNAKPRNTLPITGKRPLTQTTP